MEKTAMEHHHYKYIYGPVSSWRLGRSLGIDPVSTEEKTCSFNCVYCQAGETLVLTAERMVFVSTKDLIAELRKVPEVPLDFITFAGNGEPTLAQNLGEMIREVRKARSGRIAVITNASLIWRPDVREDLALADLVVAKLDAGSEGAFKKVNRPALAITIEEVCGGLMDFRKLFKGKLALQIMFVDANKDLAGEIARLARDIGPDEIEVNTPLRACDVEPLSPEQLEPIAEIFRKVCKNIPIRSVYEKERQKSAPFCQKATERRRGKE